MRWEKIMIGKRIGCGLLALMAAPAAAQPPAEWVGQAPLPDLVIGYQQAAGGSMIVERIPPRETVERWSRMVTNQRFAGVAARGVTLDQWSAIFLNGLGTDCPGFHGGVTARPTVSGQPAIDIRIDCPRNPATGEPETFLLRAIAGRTDLHVAQIAFRHLPSAAETEWALSHLASVTLCTRESEAGVCRAGPESFDR